jgi:hypothetical protein
VHYLAPLHPTLEWAADRALAALGRNEVFAVAGASNSRGTEPSVLVHGALTNARGQLIASSYLLVTGMMVEPCASMPEALERAGFAGPQVNTGSLTDDHQDQLNSYIAPAVRAAADYLATVVQAAADDVETRVRGWASRVDDWEQAAGELFQREGLKQRRRVIAEELGIARSMRPEQQSVRALLVVVPAKGDA